MINRQSIAAIVAAVALATGISTSVLYDTADGVSEEEGRATVAYADLADPKLATVCYGETQGVQFGDTYTPEQCAEMLIKRLPDYILPIKKMLPNLPDHRLVEYSKAAWNLGVGVVTRRIQRCEKADKQGKCVQWGDIPGTSIKDMELAGYWQGACARLLSFTAGGGKHFNGLIKRREKEFSRCMGGAL